MNREDLDRLNAEGKAWRQRNTPDQNQKPATAVKDTPVPTQLPLWSRADRRRAGLSGKRTVQRVFAT
jgi:hypothetical protein